VKHGRILQVLGVALALVSMARAQTTRRISISTGGQQGDLHSIGPSISADGLFVAFESDSTDLVAGDTNARFDIFGRVLSTALTEIESVGAGSTLGTFDSLHASVSADGRYVAFDSASIFVAGDTNGLTDVFVHDRVLGATQRISVSSSGVEGNGQSFFPSISADGRFVAFTSVASNLVAGDTNNALDVFVRDRLNAVTERVSVSSGGVQGNSSSVNPSISGDGRYVAFQSAATNLVSGDTNAHRDIFVRDRSSGSTVRASMNNSGFQGDDDSLDPSISADGRFVAFASNATNLIGPLAFDTNGFEDVFVRDLVNNSTGRASVSTSNAQGNEASRKPAISADGRFVAFESKASNLVGADTNNDTDVFVRDRSASTTERVSQSSNGTLGNDVSANP
jgi:Tol biopolymer transport system component